LSEVTTDIWVTLKLKLKLLRTFDNWSRKTLILIANLVTI